MIKGIGVDIIEVSRIQEAIEKYADKFLNRIYTKEEQDYCNEFKDKKYIHYAARFAVKEAFSKAIGTGITQGFKFHNIATHNKENGEPVILLSDYFSGKYSHFKFHVTISHTDQNAIAVVIMEE